MDELRPKVLGSQRITKVAVTGLFDLYDHTIELNETDRITIVHGPNGVGKTVLLKAIAAFFRGNYATLNNTPFSTLTIWLDHGERVEISRVQVGSRGSQPHFGIDVALRGGEGLDLGASYRIELPEEFGRLASAIARNIPGLQQSGPDEFFDARLGTTLDAEQVIWRYADHPATPNAYKRRISSIEPSEVREFRQRVKVVMIETNRLYKVDFNQLEYAAAVQLRDRITDYATQLSERIDQTLADYGRNAQKLDQTFPHRLISARFIELDVDALQKSIKDLDDTQRSLSEFGLLEKMAAIPFADDHSLIQGAQLAALTLFTRDIKEKIAVLEPLSNRIRLFLSRINSKLKNKQIHISKGTGLVAKDALGNVLPLEHLSSGEQHEIVLAFELVFNIPADALVLIDEPELSLHVTWQRLFLPELINISREVGFDCIVATHSPFIVGSRSDLLVLLDADPDVDLPPQQEGDEELGSPVADA